MSTDRSPSSPAAVFYEEAFVADSLFLPAEALLSAARGVGARVIGAEELIAGIPDGVGVLIWPYGGYYPVEARAAIEGFFARGGDLIVLGDGPLWFGCARTEGRWRVDESRHAASPFWTMPYGGRLGLATWAVTCGSEVSDPAPWFYIADEFAESFGSAKKLSCACFVSRLCVREAGRTVVIGLAGENCSASPEITEFVTLAEPASVPAMNGRVVGVGVKPSEGWTAENASDLLKGLLAVLEADRPRRLPQGMRLTPCVIRQEGAVTCELWRRPAAEPCIRVEVSLWRSEDQEERLFSREVEVSGADPVAIALPTDQLAAGGYRVCVTAEGCEAIVARCAVLDAADAEPPVVRAKQVNGYAAFEIDGRTIPALDYCFIPGDLSLDREVRDFGRAGVHIHTVQYSFADGWTGPGRFDWSGFDELAERVFLSDPQAYLYPRLNMSAPRWWLERYPEEREVLRHHPDGEGMEAVMARRMASWTSPKWRADMEELIDDFVRHTLASVYGSRMFGFFYMNGECGEWNRYGPDMAMSWEDLSPSMIETFRRWLRSYYADPSERIRRWAKLRDFTVDQVRFPNSDFLQASNHRHHFLDKPEKVAAWAHDIAPAEIDEATLPNAVRRHVSRYGLFKDAEQSWDTIEFYRFFDVYFTDLLAWFATRFKRASGGRSLVGTFTGYLLQEWFNDVDQGRESMGLQRLLERATDLDVITSPYYYYRTENVTGDVNCKAVHGSINLSRVLFVDENDQRTCLTARWKEPGGIGYPGDQTIEETAESIKRNFVLRLTRGAGLWWFDFGLGWYDHPKIMQAVRRCREVHELALNEPNPAAAADRIDFLNVMYSTASYDVFTPCSRFARCNTAANVQRHFNRTGTPWEVFFLEDIARAPRRRAYLFLNTFAVEAEQREFIETQLKRNGNVLIWLYGAGLYEDYHPSLEHIRRLTGLEVAWDFAWHEIDIALSHFDHPITAGLRGVDLGDFGTTVQDDPGTQGDLARVCPQFRMTDPRATILGVNRPTGQAAMAAGDFGDWKSVVVCGPMLPDPVLRGILGWAGIRPVLDTDDCLYTNGDFVGIHAKTTGEKTISLPAEFRVTDLFSDKTYGSREGRVRIPMERAETFVGRIYRR